MKPPWILRRIWCELTDHDRRTETSVWSWIAEVTWCVRCGYLWP